MRTLFLGLVSLVACGEPAPEAPIPAEQFAAIYADLVAEQAIHPDQFDSLRVIILERHGISSDEFNAAATFFRDHPEEWQVVLEKVVELLEEKVNRLAAVDSLQTRADTLKVGERLVPPQPR